MMKQHFYISICFTKALLLLLLSPFSAQAATLKLKNHDSVNPQDVVVALIPKAPNTDASQANITKKVAQKDYEFHPRITVVQKGDSIAFPNRDSSHHNVYSFSEAKRFDFQLFQGPRETLKMDKAGIISIGCNIHDWMLAYVVVVNTPYYGVANKNGEINLPDLPTGAYEITVWHPGLSPQDGPITQGHINISENKPVSISIPVGEPHPWPKKPTYVEDEY